MTSITHKYCSKCGKTKSIDSFWRFKRGKDGYQNRCKSCLLLDIKKAQLGRYHKIKNRFFDMYGRVCSCCGESHIEFLTIEHKLGQRGMKVKAASLDAYSKASKKYQPELYEVLCLNCNHAKGRFGECPHKH